MKIMNTGRITEKIYQSMQLREISSVVNGILTNKIAANSIIPTDLEMLRQEATRVQKKMTNYSVDRVMLLLIVGSLIGPYLEQEPEAMDFFMNWIAAESKVFDVKDFYKNPYIQNIDFTYQENGDYELRNHEKKPYELDIYNIPKHIDELYIDIPRIGCFSEEFIYPAIFQKSRKETWMSVSPNEVFTMKQPIKNAKGRVLTLGCGMGYFAYMASLKEDVESVTIIELEQSVIDLFEKCLLPQFKNKEKIKIIKADAVEYLRNMEDGEFDYCFADIWIGVLDIVPYFAVKEIGRNFRKTKMEYWIEESFATLLTTQVWIEIMTAFSEANNINVPPIDEELMTDAARREKAYIHNLLKDVNITKPEHIDYYMNPKNIIYLINNTDIIF